MPFPILGLAGLVAQAVPAVASLFDNDTEDNMTSKAIKAIGAVGKSMTRADDEASAVQALQADPDLMAKFIEAGKEKVIEVAREETKRLQTINETIRAEISSEDRYVRRWRPTFGYAVALTWVMTMGAIAYAIITTPLQAPAIIAALVNTSPIWGIALGVLGVSVIKRSKDKETAADMANKGGALEKAVSALRGVLPEKPV